MSDIKMAFSHTESFFGKLPYNRAYQIVTKFILAINTTKNARKNNGFVHTRRGSPASSHGFQPTHSEKNVGTLKYFFNSAKPVGLEMHSFKKSSQTNSKLLNYLFLKIPVAGFTSSKYSKHRNCTPLHSLGKEDKG